MSMSKQRPHQSRTPCNHRSMHASTSLRTITIILAVLVTNHRRICTLLAAIQANLCMNPGAVNIAFLSTWTSRYSEMLVLERASLGNIGADHGCACAGHTCIASRPRHPKVHPSSPGKMFCVRFACLSLFAWSRRTRPFEAV
jgi:hypothetical protein